MRSKIVVLISGSGSNLQAIIDACESGEINGDVVAVISNKTEAYGLTRAKNHHIPAFAINHKEYAGRELFDNELANKINEFSPDLIVLAGFMRILSTGFVQKFSGRLLNIHPSLLPKYPGLHTHQRALENHDKQHGASIHFVNDELDGGPVVLQSVIDVQEKDSVESLASRVAITEWEIYPLAVKWFCSGALKIDKEQVWLNEAIVDLSSFTRRKQCIDTQGQEFSCDIIIKYTQESDNAEETS